MIKLLTIYIISALIILLIDWKVMRTLAPINRWLTVAFLIIGFGIWDYSLHYKHVVYGSVWIGSILKRFIPF